MTDHAKQNAAAWMQTICDYESGREALARDAETVTIDGETFDDNDALRERIQELPLSVQVRGTWHTPGDDQSAREPVEFEILLSTGGPALRIRGGLNEYNEPCQPRLQYQDWGTPWTDYRLNAEEERALDAFCGLFYFGE